MIIHNNKIDLYLMKFPYNKIIKFEPFAFFYLNNEKL